MIRLRRSTSAVHVRRRDLFKYPDFRNAIGGQFVSQSADALATLTLAQLLLFKFSDGPSIAALTSALVASALPLLLVGPIAGHLADRLPRKLLLCRGNALRGVITLCGIFATTASTRWFGYIIFGLLVALTRILYTARASSLAQLVRKHELVAADSTSLILSVIAGAIGAGIGTRISGSLPLVALVIAGSSQILAAWLYGRVSIPLGGGNSSAKHCDFRSLASQFVSAKTRFAILATSLHRLMLGVCIASIALMVDHSYHLQTTGYVTVLGFSAAGSFAGSITAEWLSERYPRRSITVMSFVLAATAIGAAAVFENPRVGLVAVAICSLSFQNLRIRSDATIQANASKENVGRIFAAYDVLYNAAFLGGCATGILASGVLKYSEILSVVTIGYACNAAIFLRMRDGKRSEDQAHPSIIASFDNRLVSIEQDADALTHNNIDSPRHEESTDDRVVVVKA
ncbi:MFS transporter [bacterium]|nr:MFS transporter [bacterium]